MTACIDVPRNDPLPDNLIERARKGEVFVIRGCLQRLDLFDEIRASTVDAIRKVGGDAMAKAVSDDGIEKIHKHADLPQIDSITGAAYEISTANAHKWATRVAGGLFGLTKGFYYERIPNIRFHVPYDMLAADPRMLKKFAAARGGGKLSAHPNHRDSWVGCPDNLINVWAAVAPIREGNGLIVFPDAFDRDIKHNGPSIARDENPGEPLVPDLEAGDAIIFHGDHLHSSVLNRIDETRHAISFRIVPEKPNFSNGHYHHYVHASLASGPLKMFAGLPANMAWSYLGTRFAWLGERFGRKAREAAKPQNREHIEPSVLRSGYRTFRLSDIAEDTIHAISDDVCVARIGKSRVVAFDRRCPHGGSDLALGTVTDGEVTCPWHNLRFDPKSGSSGCKTLDPLRLYDVRIDGDEVQVTLSKTAHAHAAE